MEGYAEKLERKPKWPKELAKASWMAPLLGICANTFLRKANASPTITGILFFVLATMGLLMGLAALSRVPKYGREGVLAPSLIGIALSLLYVLVGTAAFMKGRASTTAVLMKREVALAKEKLPIDLGDGTVFVGLRYERPKTLIYDYEVTSQGEEAETDWESWREELTRTSCTGWLAGLDDTEALLKFRYTIDGERLIELDIPASDCE